MTTPPKITKSKLPPEDALYAPLYTYYFNYDNYPYTVKMSQEGFWKLCEATGWSLDTSEVQE